MPPRLQGAVVSQRSTRVPRPIEESTPMPFSVQMPALGESVTEGTVTRWLKQEGDTVDVDEPLLEVSTDKVDTEIPSPAAGVLSRIIAQEDDTVEVGGTLAEISDSAEDSGGTGETADRSESAAEQPAAPAAEEPEAPAAADTQPDASAQQSPPPAGGGDSQPVRMPELGESVTEGTVTRWLKKVGDSVQVDEALVEVSTDKVDTEIPSPIAGVLVSITAEEDDTVEVGGELARIGSADSAASAPAEHQPEPQPEPEPKAQSRPEPAPEAPAEPKAEPAEPKPEPKAPAEPSGRESGAVPYVTPLVRKLANEHDVDLSQVTGTGVGGRIRKQDVLD